MIFEVEMFNMSVGYNCQIAYFCQFNSRITCNVHGTLNSLPEIYGPVLL